MNVKAKEAQPILRRNQHFFKITTLYVVDKLSLKLLRQHRLREWQHPPSDPSRLHPCASQDPK